MMLSDEERKEIETEFKQYPQKQAASVEALKIVQRRHGWVSDPHLREVAQILGMSAEELDGVATFYNLIFRRPVGRHAILLCNSVSCWIMGYDRLYQHLQNRLGIGLGETSKDGRFTLLPTCCLGDCNHAPVMMVDEDLHRDLAPEKVDEILGRYQ
ncbi:NADH-quinone oxidoreductase, E subunit [Nitrosococcus halophilus Nc 4]|uniref:NADH-quinone oxidoreductase subunit E n=1 Tax=Nitrosococcus halophilus (strain Nc4) TaxID=472759 RepID=D5C514_NITHN|nr:NADH-quinone oxidoreductase subunit NuoE [Nitrosococcus halophilus]ADE15237.1 NADH-quinone oxidoreductase, E subunit [Nitrosococcus halophilus Nc 4]